MKKKDVESVHDETPESGAEVVPGPDGVSRPDEYLTELNRVLQSSRTTPIGAYSMAFVEAMVWKTLGVVPTRYLLEQVATCNSLAQAVKIAEEWIEDSHHLQRQQLAALAKAKRGEK